MKPRRHGRDIDVLRNHGDGIVGFEWRMSGDALIEDAPQRIKVGLGVRCALERLFGRHVGDGPHHHPRLRQPASPLTARQPEVHQLRGTVLGDDDVLRLDVPVHDPLTMGVLQSLQHLEGDLHQPRHRHGQQFPQRLSLHQLHHDRKLPAFFHRIKDGHDVRVVQLRRRLRLAEKPACPFLPEQGRAEGLDRHRPLQQAVLSAVHHPHSAFAQLGVDAVAVPQQRPDHDGTVPASDP